MKTNDCYPLHAQLIAGLGMFGDALTCPTCGFSAYPEGMPFTETLMRILGRIVYDPTPEQLRAASAAYSRRLGHCICPVSMVPGTPIVTVNPHCIVHGD